MLKKSTIISGAANAHQDEELAKVAAAAIK